MRIFSVLLELGFKSLFSDNFFFQLHNDQGSIYVLVYVDDLLFSGSTSLCDWLETKLCESFKMKFTTKLTTYIGINTRYEQDVVYLNQKGHIDKAIKRFEINPLSEEVIPIKDDTINENVGKKLEDIELYQQLVGTLNYLSIGTRPDILYATNWLARKVSSATTTDIKKAKNVFKYLNATRELEMKFHKLDLSNPSINVFGFCHISRYECYSF